MRVDVPVVKYSYVSPPRAWVSGGGYPGQPLVLPTSTTAAAVELDTALVIPANYAAHYAQQSQNLPYPAPPGQQAGLVGNYITMLAVTGIVGFIFGQYAQQVIGANAPVIATNGTVSATASVSGTNGACAIGTAAQGTFVFTDATASNFTAAMVGKFLQVTTAGGLAGYWQISGFISSTQVVLTGNPPGTFSAQSWNVVTGGQYTGGTGTCIQLPVGQYLRLHTQPGIDNWIGYVASATGQLLVWQSNPAGLEQ
jgi:hypothetical protein